MTIGERLRIVRGSRSRREVAALVGMKQQAWAVYESNQSAPGAKLIIKIAKTFGVSTDWLLGVDEKPQVVATNSAVVIGVGDATNNLPTAGKALICKRCPIKRKLEKMKKMIEIGED